jgi:hypothetical protein
MLMSSKFMSVVFLLSFSLNLTQDIKTEGFDFASLQKLHLKLTDVANKVAGVDGIEGNGAEKEQQAHGNFFHETYIFFKVIENCQNITMYHVLQTAKLCVKLVLTLAIRLLVFFMGLLPPIMWVSIWAIYPLRLWPTQYHTESTCIQKCVWIQSCKTECHRFDFQFQSN